MSTDAVPSFASLGSSIDGRLLRSLAAQGFTHPTPIQAAIFPLALKEGKDILARARTGSGKTLAYGIPLVQRILTARRKLEGGYAGNENYLATRCLILVPTRELAEQVTDHLKTLCQFLTEQDAVRVVSLASGTQNSGKGKGKASSDKIQKMALADKPDVVVATPSRALMHLRAKSLDLAHLESLVIDEADLILSYGHSSEDIQAILSGGSEWSLPTMYQSFLMSATLTGEVDELKGVVLRNPVTIKLSDAASSASTSSSSTSSALSQYVIHTTEDDKFLLIYVLLKLRLVKGKVLIFVNDTDRGYRVKLFLEKFGIRAGVLNAELPFNSRYHAVQEFNRGVFQYLIATDESGLEGVEQDSDDEGDEENQAAASTALMSTQPDGGDMDEVEGQEGDAEDAEPEASASTTGQKRKHSAISAPPASSSKKRKSKTSFKTAEYGVTRGIDFVDVACVLNFDLPASSRSYVHRVGRTARAGRSGMSLSFVVPKAQWGPKHQHGLDTSLKSARRDEKIWKRIEKGQRAAGVANESLKEYRFDMQQVEGFRYRMEDGLRSVTRAAVREARIKELKNEVLNSEKLKAHFEDNPRDLAFLKHDKPLHPSRIQPHMKHVPSYLMPRIAPVGGASSSNADAGSDGTQTKSDGTSSKFVPFRKNNARGGKSARGKGRGGKTGGSRKDPLKTFKRK